MFERLLSPLQVGPVVVPNRVVFTAHTTNMSADENLVGDQLVAYHAERANGGAGLIVLEASAVHPGADIHGTSLRAYDGRIVEQYDRMADAIRASGARLVVQLFHSGAQSSFQKTLHVAWSPSGVPSSVNRESPHVMDHGDIAELVDCFAAAAANVARSGVDGAEVHLGHSYLLAQFLSPLFNARTDEFGGSLENRMRLSVLVLERVREALGPERVLGVRVSGEELMPNGLTRDEMAIVCRTLEERGLVDYINVSVGSHHTRHMMVAPMSVEPGYLLDLCRYIRRSVGETPVSCVGRVNTPELAEHALADGIADLVGMTRAQIADPELVRKVAEGRRREIRPCIGSNQGCRGRFFLGLPITCTVNPAVGFERTHGVASLAAATRPRKVLVAGAGPAGLKVAEIAAKRGHAVEVCDRAGAVGGQLALARRLPGRSEIFGVVTHLAEELDRLDVPVRLGCEVDAALVASEQPDVVIVATGARPSRSAFAGVDPRVAEIKGADSERVVFVDDVLSGSAIGRRVLLVAEEPGQQTLGVAQLLADAGHLVTVAGSAQTPGDDLLPMGDFQILYPKLVDQGVLFQGSTLVSGIDGATVTAIDAVTSASRVLGAFDSVVLSMGREPVAALRSELDGVAREVHCIGDALAPRKIDSAIFEADRLGRAL